MKLEERITIIVSTYHFLGADKLSFCWLGGFIWIFFFLTGNKILQGDERILQN